MALGRRRRSGLYLPTDTKNMECSLAICLALVLVYLTHSSISGHHRLRPRCCLGHASFPELVQRQGSRNPYVRIPPDSCLALSATITFFFFVSSRCRPDPVGAERRTWVIHTKDGSTPKGIQDGIYRDFLRRRKRDKRCGVVSLRPGLPV